MRDGGTPPGTDVDRGAWLRKTLHLTSPMWLLWYWVPPDAWVGVRKEAILLVSLSVVLLVEAARLLGWLRIPGFREYEASRVAAYAWGSVGLAVGLLFFPGELVIPTFWGMAWIDPLCGLARKQGGYPVLPVVAYAALAAFLLLVVVPLAPYQTTAPDLARVAVFVPVAAIVGVAAERPNLRYVDDDFVMHVAPLLVLAALAAAVPWPTP